MSSRVKISGVPKVPVHFTKRFEFERFCGPKKQTQKYLSNNVHCTTYIIFIVNMPLILCCYSFLRIYLLRLPLKKHYVHGYQILRSLVVHSFYSLDVYQSCKGKCPPNSCYDWWAPELESAMIFRFFLRS